MGSGRCGKGHDTGMLNTDIRSHGLFQADESHDYSHDPCPAWQQACPLGTCGFLLLHLAYQANPLFPVGPFPRPRIPGPLFPTSSPLRNVNFSPSPPLPLVP